MAPRPTNVPGPGILRAATIRLTDYLAPESIGLDIKATDKEGVFEEIVSLLPIRPTDRSVALEILRQREAIGSTGIGMGVAVPHCRSTIFPRMMVAFGRSQAGVPFQAVDRRKVHLFFLIVSPAVEVASNYHQVLAAIVNVAKEEHYRKRLLAAESAVEVRSILGEAVF